MLPVRFTDHALLRCKQQEIAPESISRKVAGIPQFKGALKWRVARYILAIMVHKSDHILIITVVGKSKLQYTERKR